jgi:hypothetical protein
MKTQKSSVIVQHWRGDLSLGVSFWLAGVLGLIIAHQFWAAWSTCIAHITSNIGVLDLGGLAVIMFQSVVVVWQLVGTWRSAGRRLASGGSPLWPYLARGFAGLLAFFFCGLVISNLLVQIKQMSDPEYLRLPTYGAPWSNFCR